MPSLLNSSSITGRRTLVSWLCPNNHRNEGSSRECIQCGYGRIERHAQVHTADRAVVYVNPATGERRTPPRADQPIPEVYARQGFERREIMSMTAWEKESGLVHEQSNFSAGNEPVPEERHPEIHAPKEVISRIVNEVRAAHQSGNWTLDTPLSDSPSGG